MKKILIFLCLVMVMIGDYFNGAKKAGADGIRCRESYCEMLVNDEFLSLQNTLA